MTNLKTNKIYRYTKGGLLAHIYAHQRASSKIRNHPLPNYSLEELKTWVFNIEKFNILFKEWELSDFDKKLIPSLDRIDDYLPYKLSNLQIVTWDENNKKHYNDVLNNKNNKHKRPVIGMHKLTNQTVNFTSLSEASRFTGANSSNIQAVCKGKKKSAAGWLWKYKFIRKEKEE